MRVSCYIWNHIENAATYCYTSVMDMWTQRLFQNGLLCLLLVVCVKVFGTDKLHAYHFVCYIITVFPLDVTHVCN